MRALKIPLVLILVSSTMGGQTALRKELRVKIESISPTSSGFNIVASVTNLGSQPVILAKAADPHRGTLQSLNVEQWDEKLGPAPQRTVCICSVSCLLSPGRRS